MKNHHQTERKKVEWKFIKVLRTYKKVFLYDYSMTLSSYQLKMKGNVIMRNDNKIIRSAIYIRVSTQDQARNGFSLQAQKEKLEEYCKEKGYKIVDIYKDEGKSARTKLRNRKELLRLLEDVKDNKIDRIVMWRLDRWFRNVADYYEVQKILDAYHVDWECSDEEYDTYTTNGRLHLNIKLSIAQNESDQTGDRIRFDFENMIKNKRPIMGTRCLPLGLKVVGEKKDKRIIKDEETEDIVNDMFDHFEMCGSIRKTVSYINEKYKLNILYECISKYLKNPMYYGKYRDVEDYCPAYITKERHDNIQSLIQKNCRNNKKRHDYIFSGLIRCRECGYVMAGASNRNQSYYRCKHHYMDGFCNNKKYVRQNNLEDWLLKNFILELQNQNTKLKKALKKEEKIIVRDISKLKAKQSRLNDLYIEGRISKERYDKEYNEIEAELKKSSNIEEKNTMKKLTEYDKILNKNDIFDIYNKFSVTNKRLFWSKYIDFIEQNEENDYKIYFK